jgi:hypothetical protein
VKAHEEFERARRCVNDAKARMKITHDQRGVNTHVYNINDLVWFNVKNLGLRHDSRRHKLLPKFWGPFKVINLVGRNAVLLDFPQHLRHIHPVVSVTLLKPHVPRSGEPPPVHYWGEEEFELDLITDFNIRKSKRQNVADEVEFKVKWKGAYADTWHAPSDFHNAQETLITFLMPLNKRDRTNVLKAFDPDSLGKLPQTLRSQVSS